MENKFHEKFKEYLHQQNIYYDKAIELYPDDIDALLNRGDIKYQLGDLQGALDDYNKAIELYPDDIDALLSRGSIKDELGDLQGALDDYNKVIEQIPVYVYHPVFLDRGRIKVKLGDLQGAIDDYDKAIELDPENSNAYDNLGTAYFKIGDNEKSIENIEKALELEPDNKEFRDNLVFVKTSIARVEERDKVIAELSHSIKNLISTVKDPLINLKESDLENSAIIDDAIKGTNLIRNIVNAMNLSYTGTIDDFYQDAADSNQLNSISLGDILFNSIKSSIPNMFDKKYFGEFLRNYFPDRNIFTEATGRWNLITENSSNNDLIRYLNQYFFTLKIDMGNTGHLKLADNNGSAVKLLILFQEAVFNAIKYSCFIPKEERIVDIKLIKTDKIIFTIANKYNPDYTSKKSGLGHVIINNFSKLLKTTPIVTKSENLYSLTIKLPDLWSRKE